MRGLIWLLILLAALWGAWWVTATTQMQGAASNWLESRRAADWEVTAGPVTTSGFPLRLQTGVTGLTLADPAQETKLQANAMSLVAPTWWPGDLSLTAPQATLETRAGALPLTLTAAEFKAALSLHPSLALELDRLTAASAALRIDGPDGRLLDLAKPQAELQQSTEDSTRYALTLLPGEITPGPLLEKLFAQDGAPAAAPQIEARADLGFARPLDRQTAQRRAPPRLRSVDLQELRLAWGEIVLTSSGALTFDAQGQPEGTLNLQVTNWRRLIDIGQRAGLLPASMRLQVETMLGALENRGATPGGLDFDLTFVEGQMSLAGIPLGPTPPLLR